MNLIFYIFIKNHIHFIYLILSGYLFKEIYLVATFHVESLMLSTHKMVKHKLTILQGLWRLFGHFVDTNRAQNNVTTAVESFHGHLTFALTFNLSNYYLAVPWPILIHSQGKASLRA